MKIDIQTPNKKYATDIALLVDKPEFMQALKRLREKWQIEKLYKLSSFPVFMEWHIMTKNDTLSKDKDIKNRLSEFNKDIDLVLKKFNRGKNFKMVIEYALATGIVPNGAYRSCYFDLIKIGEPEDLEQPERYEYAIVLSPRTELQEVEKVYKEFKKHIKRKIIFDSIPSFDINLPTDKEIIEQYHKGNTYKAADIDKFKTLKELNRTRDWYWIAYNNGNKKRKRSEDILNEWQEQNCSVKTDHPDIESKRKCPYCSIEDINIVDQALSSYSKLLQIS